MRSSRMIIYELLMDMEKKAYSNIALDSVLSASKEKLSSEDRRFISRIFYGVLERKLTLDHIISQYGSKTADKLDTEVRTVLRMGIYQILYCDSVPDSAAVNESVKLIKQTKKSGASGFVNGLLRGFIRGGYKYSLPENKYEALSVEYSCAPDIVRLLTDNYPEEDVISLLSSSFLPTDITVRVNNVKTDREQFSEKILSEAEECTFSDIAPLRGLCAEIKNISAGSPGAMKAFEQGFFHVQDISSQLCCAVLDPQENDIVIDVCAAPGGKTFTAAEMMNNKGTIYAGELHSNRTKLIQKGAERLGLDCIKAVCSDAKVYDPKLPQADRVLCDVPCSGLGVMRGKPEIKYKNTDQFSGLPKIQYDILETASKYVKSGGVLVYSTCTVNPAENDEVVEKFLSEHSGFEGYDISAEWGQPFGSYKATIFPRHFGSDGFFICRMRKK